MEIDNYIRQLESEAAERTKTAAVVRSLKERFPDLEVHKNRWNRVRFTSESINSIANEVEVHHSCGCCADSPLLVTPVYVEGDTRVHGTVEICIGEANQWGYGDILDPDWEERLRTKNVSDVVIEKIKAYASENEPEDYDDDDFEE